MLGLDDEISRDHDWGLRLTLLVEDDLAGEVRNYLEQHLPNTAHGLPVRFATTWDPTVRRCTEVDTAQSFVASRLGLDPARGRSAQVSH